MAFEVVDHDSTTFTMHGGSVDNLDMKTVIKILSVTAQFDWKLVDVTGLGDTETAWIRGGFLTVTGSIIGSTLGGTAQSIGLFDGIQGQLKIKTDSGMTLDSGANNCFFQQSTIEMRYDSKGLGRVPCTWTYIMSQPLIDGARDYNDHEIAGLGAV